MKSMKSTESTNYDFEAALSTRPKRVIPSSYLFLPITDSKDIVLADASARELRRRVGERQSLTNYYKSDTFYEKQGYLFKPITESDKSTQKTLTDYTKGNKELLKTLSDNNTALTDTLNKNTSFMETLTDMMKKQDSTVEREFSVERRDVEEMFRNRPPDGTYFEIVIDGDQYGTMPVVRELAEDWNKYFVKLIPERSDNYTHIQVERPDGSKHFPLSLDLAKVLASNILIDTAKSKYMDILHFFIGRELMDAYRDFLNDTNTGIAWEFDKWDKKSKKFRNWIVPEYNIDMIKIKRYIQQDEADYTELTRNEEQENKITEETEKPFGSVTKRLLPAAPTPKREGKGIHSKHSKHNKYIVISPNVKDRMNKIKVLLGSRRSGNNVGLEEYTAILDSLLKDNRIDKVRYQSFMKIWKQNSWKQLPQ